MPLSDRLACRSRCAVIWADAWTGIFALSSFRCHLEWDSLKWRHRALTHRYQRMPRFASLILLDIQESHQRWSCCFSSLAGRKDQVPERRQSQASFLWISWRTRISNCRSSWMAGRANRISSGLPARNCTMWRSCTRLMPASLLRTSQRNSLVAYKSPQSAPWSRRYLLHWVLCAVGT